MDFGGSWTELKLQIVEDYLQSYLTALKDTPFELTYVDAFAGKGYRAARRTDPSLSGFFEGFGEEEEQFLKGSATRAAHLSPQFHKYIFIEQSPDNIASLKSLIAKSPASNKSEILGGDANAVVIEMCRKWPTNRRAVMFLDPFALQVRWATIVEIAKTKRVDMWLLFPLGAVLRLLVKDGQVPDAWGKQLTEIFGTDDWRQKLYQRTAAADLFGDVSESIERSTFQDVLKFFNSRLATVFYKVAPSPAVLRNSKNSPLFGLCFAAANEKGAPIAIRIAKHILENA